MARGKVVGRYGPQRASKKGDDGEANRWMGTYGDAITLLLAFVVMLYAMAEVDIEKFNAFLSGLEIPFGNTQAVEMMDRSTALVGDHGAQEPSSLPGANTTPEQAGADPLADLPPLEAADPSQAALAQLEEVRAALDRSLEAAGVSQVVSAELIRRGLVVSIAADDVLFSTGSADLTGEGRGIVAAVTAPLLEVPNDVMVEGHTDDVPLRRPGYSNWNLSTDRAVSVLRLMYSELGMPQQRLGAVGYGEFRPRVPNSDPASRSLNRRVDIVITALTEATQ